MNNIVIYFFCVDKRLLNLSKYKTFTSTSQIARNVHNDGELKLYIYGKAGLKCKTVQVVEDW